MDQSSISLKCHQYSIQLENCFKIIYPYDCPKQGEIRINLQSNIENACNRLCAKHQNKKDSIMDFLNKYASIVENIDDLYKDVGEDYIEEFIINFKHLLKGCGYNV